MYHYFEAITNTKGDALTGYCVKAVDSVTGAGATLYSDTNLTPIVSVSGLADAAKVDTNGNVSFFITGGTYDLNIYQTDGSTLAETVYQIPMIDYTIAIASVKDFGAMGDGVTDDTTALTSALASASRIHVPAGTYIVSSLSIPSNIRITTEGFATVFKQAPSTAANTRLLKIQGSNVSIDDFSVEGQLNQTGDTTGEQNHGIFIALEATSTASISNVSIGNVKGTNIRGDVVYIGTDPTAYTAGYRVSDISVGKVIGSNVYRNVASVTGGNDISIDSVTGTQVGQFAFDAEPDVGNGPITGLRVGYIKGRCVQFSGPTATDYTGACVGVIEVDPSYTTTSAPDYGGTAFHNGLTYRNVKSLRVDRFYANGHYGQAIKVSSGTLPRQELSFGNVEIPTGCTTETTYACYILSDATTFMTIDVLAATTTAAVTSQCVFCACSNAAVGVAQVSLAPATSYMRACADCCTTTANITRASGNGGVVDLSGTRNRYLGGTILCDYCFDFSGGCIAVGVNVTAASAYDNGYVSTNLFIASNVAGAYSYINDQSNTFVIGSGGALTTAGSVRSASASSPIGYNSGAGGTVTQATSKSTGVTLNKTCGQITMNAAALASGAKVSFVVTDSSVAATDIVTANVISGGTANAYRAAVTAVAAGSFTVTVENITAGSLSEAPVVGFAVLKAAAA